MFSKARVMDFSKGYSSNGYAVKGSAGRNYRKGASGYYNGNGMYMSYPEPYLSVILYVYKPYGHVVAVDIREEALEESGRCRLTETYLEDVRNANVGRKIGVWTRGNTEADIADINELDLAF